MLRTLAEDALIGGFADERDHTKGELLCQNLQPLAGTREVARTKIARATRRPSRRIREPDAVLEELGRFARCNEARRETGRVEQSPEVVPWIRERRAGRCTYPAGVDPTEDDPDTGA